MTPVATFAVRSTIGLALAAVVFVGGRARSGASATAACPQGWAAAERPALVEGARPLVTCVASAEGLDGALIQLAWSLDGTVADATLVTAARAQGFSGATLAPVREGDGAALTREHTGESLKSDVYFLSAGQRYGLLSIVYGPAATFVREDSVAAWMETVEGTAPWGAPVTPELRARCPEGFTTLRADGPGLVLRCMRGVGTRAFTVLQLMQSNGGFGSEQDRARLAGDIAQRVASGGGGAARVLVSPTPFTRARNVDAMRASFQTDERLTLDSRVAWSRAARSGNVVAVYVGPDVDRGLEATTAVLGAVHATRVSKSALYGLSGSLLVLGVALGALGAKRASVQ